MSEKNDLGEQYIAPGTSEVATAMPNLIPAKPENQTGAVPTAVEMQLYSSDENKARTRARKRMPSVSSSPFTVVANAVDLDWRAVEVSVALHDETEY